MDKNVKPSEALRRGMELYPPSTDVHQEAFRNDYFIRYWGKEHCEYSTPLGAIWAGIGHDPKTGTGVDSAKPLNDYLRKWGIVANSPVKKALGRFSYMGKPMHEKAIAILEKHEALLAEIEGGADGE